MCAQGGSATLSAASAKRSFGKSVTRTCRTVRVHAVAEGAAAARPTRVRPHHRVVVTGMGVVSPLGHDVEEFYDNLLEGRMLRLSEPYVVRVSAPFMCLCVCCGPAFLYLNVKQLGSHLYKAHPRLEYLRQCFLRYCQTHDVSIPKMA